MGAHAKSPAPSRRSVQAVLAVLAGLIVIGTAFLATSTLRHSGAISTGDHCFAEVGADTVALSIEQAQGATTLAAVGYRRDLPARAVTIAVTAAYDDLADVTPTRARALFDRLPDGYRTARIASAAARVNGTAGADELAGKVADARIVASTTTGQTPGGFWCRVPDDPPAGSLELSPAGLTPKAEELRADMTAVFGDLPVGGFAPEGVSTGHMKGSAHYEGRAVDVFFRPINAGNIRDGWVLATYLMAHGEKWGVDHVIFNAKIWSVGRRSEAGWRDYRIDVSGRPKPTADILLHHDHVHVDVA